MMPFVRSSLLCALALSVVAPIAHAQDGAQPIVTTDLLKLRAASQIEISPDGKRAVFVVTSMGTNDEDEYTYFRHLWVVALDGKNDPIQLTHGERSDRSPTWSPDGSRVAFVRKHDDKDQIWILPLAGGEARPHSSAPNGAARPRWSPDGTRLLYTSHLPMHEIEADLPWAHERPGRTWRDAPNWKALAKTNQADEGKGGNPGANDESESPSAPKGAGIQPKPDGSLAEIRAWLAQNASEASPRVLNRLDLQGEHDLAPDLTFAHLFVIDSHEGAEAQQLTDGFQDFSSAEWSPDGKRILCSSVLYAQHPDRVLDSDLWILQADGSGREPVLDWGTWMVRQAKFAPDGRSIAFLALDRNDPSYGLSRLGISNADGSRPRFIAEDFKYNIGNIKWSDDGRSIYFVSRREGSFPLLRAPTDGGEVQTIVDGNRGVRAFDVHRDRLAYALTRIENPNELYVSRTSGKGERQLTMLNSDWLRDKQLVRPEERWLERADGTRVQYWIMEPAGRAAGARYPLVLEIHGGPSAMWGPGEFTMWHEFQLLCSWGYGVVYSNPRGSSGYGYEFKKANYRNWGKRPAGDILAALDAAAELDWVDRDQLFVTGGSYAGYMTAWIVSQDHRFKAAVAQRGVYDLAVFFGEGNAWRLVPRHFGGYPWETDARRALDDNSPQAFVTNIRTPLLILHSDNDLRTGVIQSELLYKSLKVLERPVEYVRYPGEGHNLSRTGHPKLRMDRLNRIVEFFERYVEHPVAPAATISTR